MAEDAVPDEVSESPIRQLRQRLRDLEAENRSLRETELVELAEARVELERLNLAAAERLNLAEVFNRHGSASVSQGRPPSRDEAYMAELNAATSSDQVVQIAAKYGRLYAD